MACPTASSKVRSTTTSSTEACARPAGDLVLEGQLRIVEQFRAAPPVPPTGQPASLATLRDVQACQQYLVQVSQTRTDPTIGLLLVGFSPADRLAGLARHLGWPGQVLSDPGRLIYSRLGIGRASLRRIITGHGQLSDHFAIPDPGPSLARVARHVPYAGRVEGE